jgi:hypothetical protein
VAEGDRAPKDVELRRIDFADGLPKAGAFSPFARHEPAQVRDYLRSERLVHLHDVDVAEGDTGTAQRDRCSQHGAHQQLLARIERGIRI